MQTTIAILKLVLQYLLYGASIAILSTGSLTGAFQNL